MRTKATGRVRRCAPGAAAQNLWSELFQQATPRQLLPVYLAEHNILRTKNRHNVCNSVTLRHVMYARQVGKAWGLYMTAIRSVAPVRD